MEDEGDGDTNYNCCTRNGPHRLRKGTGTSVYQGKDRDYLNYNIIEIDQNIEQSPGDLKKIMLKRKTHQKENNNYKFMRKSNSKVITLNFDFSKYFQCILLISQSFKKLLNPHQHSQLRP